MPKKFKSDKQLQRGESDIRGKNHLYCLKWMDNRSVHMLSNYLSPATNETIKRRTKGSSEKLDITCPTMIKEYNAHMGGVDIMDAKQTSYGLDRRSKSKYYIRPFFDLLSIAILNAEIIERKLESSSDSSTGHQESKDYHRSLKFRREVAMALIGSYSSRQRIQASRASSVYSSGDNTHIPIKLETRKRCSYCYKHDKIDRKANMFCEICNAALCLTKERNCFQRHHVQYRYLIMVIKIFVR